MKEIKILLNKVAVSIKSLESNLLSEICESRVSTEMILKQIAAYLNVSARNLSEVQDTVIKFNASIDNIKNEINKINTIENEIVKLPNETYKIKEHFNTYSNNIKLLLNTLYTQASKILNILATQENKLNGLEESNQKRLMELIEMLVGNKKNADDGDVKIKTTEMEQKTKKFEIKSNLIGKIVVVILGSGGVIYFIVDTIIKLTAGQ